MLRNRIIGFLGAGSIVEALVQGILSAGLTAPNQIWVTNRSDWERLDSLAVRFGVKTTHDKQLVVDRADILVIACKPKDVAELLAEVGGSTRAGHVVLSVAAGITTAVVAAGVTHGVEVLRAMPNTSSRVLESATALCGAEGTSPEAMAIGRQILGAVGTVVEVPEGQLDAVTGLSGSGPAYIYFMVEAMVQAGVRVGLERDVAYQLAVQTVIGAGKMLRETGMDPGVLRQKVTSPGGTTEAGLRTMAERHFVETVVAGIARATERSRELGELPALRQPAPTD